MSDTPFGGGITENGEALFRTIELFRTVAVEGGSLLGYAYPDAFEQGVLACVRKLHDLARPAPQVGRA